MEETSSNNDNQQNNNLKDEQKIEEKPEEKQENNEIANENNEIKKESKESEEIGNNQEHKEEKKPEENKEKNKKSYKKFFIILGIVLVIIIISIILFSVFNGPEGRTFFRYNDFVFEKIPFEGIYIYESNVTLINLGKYYTINLRLRNDPRELEDIYMSSIRLPHNVSFSVTPETLNCSSDALIASFQIGQYLKRLGFTVTPSVTENFTGNTLPIRNCSYASNSSGIIILRPFSNQTRVYQEVDRCVILEAEGCNVTAVSEKLILNIVEKLKAPEKFGNLF